MVFFGSALKLLGVKVQQFNKLCWYTLSFYHVKTQKLFNVSSSSNLVNICMINIIYVLSILFVAVESSQYCEILGQFHWWWIFLYCYWILWGKDWSLTSSLPTVTTYWLSYQPHYHTDNWTEQHLFYPERVIYPAVLLCGNSACIQLCAPVFVGF